MVDPQDDLRHKADTEDVNWSESYYFSFRDISNKISGFFRMGLRENAKDSNVWACLYHNGKVIYQKFKFNLPYNGSGLENITIDGLHFSSLELLTSYNIRFQDRVIDVNLRWDGFHEVIDIGKLKGKLSEALAAGHHEQAGIVRGTVRLDNQLIPVDGIGFRDHSWGVRNWEGIKNWIACAGLISEDFCFHAAEINEMSGKTSCLGFLYENGKVQGISNASMAVDDLWQPASGLLTLTKNDGDSVKVDVEFHPKQVGQMPMEFSLVSEYYVGLKANSRVGAGFLEINRSLFYDD